MRAMALILTGAAVALSGCNLVGGAVGGNEVAEAENAAAATGNAVAEAPLSGDKRPTGEIRDAGITNSRSLQAFAGGGSPDGGVALGGKEPLPGEGGTVGSAGGGSIISAQGLVGRWADNPDCSMDVTFFANGTFRSFNGGRGNWRLNGNSLTLTGGGGDHRMEILSFDGQIMQLRNPDGSIGRSRRC